MNLKKFAAVINECVEKAGGSDPSIEIWLNDTEYAIESIGQYGVIPDVVIHLKELANDTT